MRLRRFSAPESRCSLRGVVAAATALVLAVSGVPVPAFARAESVRSAAGVEDTVPADLVAQRDQVPSIQDDDEDIAHGTWGTCPWVINSSGELRVGAGTGADTTDASPWCDYVGQIAAIAFDGEVVLPERCDHLFEGLSRVTGMDASGLNTSSVTSMEEMFKGCSELTSLNVNGWDTSKVTSMAWMFGYCRELRSLDLSGWDVSNVTNMSDMFCECSLLRQLVTQGWKVTAAKDMSRMFSGCGELESLDLSGWGVESVTSMYGMFRFCDTLTSLDCSGWNTSRATDLESAFEGCGSLTSLNTSDWDTSSVTSLYHTFTNCASLQTLDLSHWDTSSVASMTGMFDFCSSLSSLNLSGWDTSRILGEDWLFSGCSPRAITVGDRYLMWGGGFFPEASYGFMWRSSTTGQLYSRDEVATMRSGIADTYTQVEVGTNDLSRAVVAVSPSTFFYDGTNKTPAVKVVLDDKVLEKSVDYTVSYRNNVGPGTATVTVTGKGAYKGTKSATFQIIDDAPEPTPTPTPTPASERVNMYRLYNPYSGEHFYTASKDERNQLAGIGWSYEGIGWVAPGESNLPVYRLYNPYAGDHHYTTSIEERDQLKDFGWNDEGIGWYSDDAKGVPLYRQYNPYATVGTHNYTTSREENDGLVSVGWQAEGIGWYGLK